MEDFVLKDFIDKPNIVLYNLEAEQEFLHLFHTRYKDSTKIFTVSSKQADGWCSNFCRGYFSDSEL